MNYASINTSDVANGPGVRVSLFVSGCRNHCLDCFNQEAWDFQYGKRFNDEAYSVIENEMLKPQISGVTILGGEPLDRKNIVEVSNIVHKLKMKYPKKTVWLYTGYTYEEILGWLKTGDDCLWVCVGLLLSAVDVIVDGRFEKDKKDLSLRFRGSRNQRIIDVRKSRIGGHVVLWNE